MTISEYINSINQRLQLGNSTEHTYRGDLQQLLESLLPDVRATNEPKRQACGAPDYILTKNEIPVGFIEAKNIGDKDLEGKKKSGNKEQFDRYKNSLSNLIFTDYIDFYLYQDGEYVTKISIGELVTKSSSFGSMSGAEIVPMTENFDSFENIIKDFCTHVGQTIKSSKKLASMMAGKARLLSDVIEKSLTSDDVNEEDSTLKEQMQAFKSILIHDITAKGFADVYAQTIAYGLFAARLHDPTLDNFSRQEAAELIPKSNPFLRKLFGYIAGPDLDDRIKWIVDNLIEIFLACNVHDLLKNYGKSTKMEDPIIHFYEDFLAEYDPKLRKARGVWYTPAPVVNFIVRAVDDVLKTEFDLPQGLADTSKTKIKLNSQTPDKRSSTGYKQIEEEVHRVQILDPATGTGTFLAEVIKHVHKKFKGQEGIWSQYVENNLLPRLNGFELLMASYAMAHLQLDLLLKETGFKPTKAQRTRVYLTNSLEEYHPDTGSLFAGWLSSEANEANHIKRDTPVMCVIGNPPYSVSSANNGNWIQNLLKDYKNNLNERNIQPLSDDYIKFIKYGQHFIDENGSGVLAYISNNSFIDGKIHRQMRNNLVNTFDDIYIIDLHGSTKKNEVAPDGTRDVNVFDIQQGVSINIFIKSNKNKQKQGNVHFAEVLGSRDLKYSWLLENNIETINWSNLNITKPHFFFVPKDFSNSKLYNKGFEIASMFPVNACGIVTARDYMLVNISKKEADKLSEDLIDLEEEEFRSSYDLRKDSRDWTYLGAKNDITNAVVTAVDYRPFDKRYLPYSPSSKGILSYPRNEIMKHMLNGKNIGISLCKQQSTFDFQHIFITKTLTDKCTISSQTKEASYHFPLYIYRQNEDQGHIGLTTERTPNLNHKIITEIAKILNLKFIAEKESSKNTFSPMDILDYVYAVLHSPVYRKKYKEFFKIDFPRVPYPKDKTKFWQLVDLGGQIRKIHLLESPKVEDYVTTYPIGGSNTITTKVGKKDWDLYDADNEIGRIWINEDQYFDKIPLVAWEFYIGGYQPAQKWLKDRKLRTLEFDDILHYQKIIVALVETDRLMKKVDEVGVE